MPALRFLGRAWLVAGDDLPVPFGIGAVLRAGGLGVLVGFAFSFAPDVTCPTVACPWLLLPGVDCVGGYIGLSVVLMAATGLLQAGIAMSASKGTIMNDRPRHALPPLLLVYTFTAVAELLLTCWAIQAFWTAELKCAGGATPGEGDEAAVVLRAVVWLQAICTSATLLGIGLTFDLSGSVHDDDVARLNRRWEARCKTLCCLATQNTSTQVALRSLAATLSNLFLGLDLVPSDGLAAMLLVALLHPEEPPDIPPARRQAQPADNGTDSSTTGREEPSNLEAGLGSMDADDERTRLMRASDFAPYASASYGWWLQTWRSCLFCKGAMRQARACASCACICSPEKYPRWVSQRALAHELPGRDYTVLLECPAQNFRPAFFIVADWSKRALVVVIRGTFSLADALTDGTAHTCILPGEDGAESESPRNYGHAGIVEAARRLVLLLHASGLLPILLSCPHAATLFHTTQLASAAADDDGPMLQAHHVYGMLGVSADDVFVDPGIFAEVRGVDAATVAGSGSGGGGGGGGGAGAQDATCVAHAVAMAGSQYVGFDLVVIGHSLGAGVAALVARELKASNRTCYHSLQCIALSPPPSISPEAAAACSAYVTSVTVGEDLVSRLSWRSLQLLRARALEALLLCRQPKWQVLVFLGLLRCVLPADDARLRDYFLVDPDSPEAMELLERHRHLFEGGDLQPPLRVPGCVLQLVGGKRTRKALVRRMQDGEEDEIRVTPRMMMHHLPDHLQRLLVKALHQMPSPVVGPASGRGAGGQVRPGGQLQAALGASGLGRPLLRDADAGE